MTVAAGALIRRMRAILTLTLIGSPSAAAVGPVRFADVSSIAAAMARRRMVTLSVLKLVNRVLRGLVKIWQTRRNGSRCREFALSDRGLRRFDTIRSNSSTD